MRILLVTMSFSDAVTVRDILPWKSFGDQFLIEMNPISSFQKIEELKPDVLLLYGSLDTASIEIYIQRLRNINKIINVIVLPNKQQWLNQQPAAVVDLGVLRIYYLKELNADNLKQTIDAIRVLDNKTVHLRTSKNDISSFFNSDELSIVTYLKSNVITDELWEIINKNLEDYSDTCKIIKRDSDVLVFQDIALSRNTISTKVAQYLEVGNYDYLLISSVPIESAFINECIVKMEFIEKNRYFCESKAIFDFNPLIPPFKLIFQNEFTSSFFALYVSLRKNNIANFLLTLKEIMHTYVFPSMNRGVLRITKLLLKEILLTIKVDGSEKIERLGEGKSCSEDLNELAEYWASSLEFSETLTIKDKAIDVAEFINKNYFENITIELLASFVNLSPSSLTKQFASTFGISIVKYINTIRVCNAALMLVQGQRSISDISKSVGINDTKYFTRLFTNKFKTPPLKFRKLYCIEGINYENR